MCNETWLLHECFNIMNRNMVLMETMMRAVA
jgi:hypothetical protein